jgi:hypothetical protein
MQTLCSDKAALRWEIREDALVMDALMRSHTDAGIRSDSYIRSLSAMAACLRDYHKCCNERESPDIPSDIWTMDSGASKVEMARLPTN